MKRLKDINALIWINHIENKEQECKIQEIRINNSVSNGSVDNLLIDIKQVQKDLLVYRIDINTSRFIEKYFNFKQEIQTNSFNLSIFDWFNEVFGNISSWKKFEIAYYIFNESGIIESALKCAEKIKLIGEESNNEKVSYLGFTLKGQIFQVKGRYLEALELFNNALTIAHTENLFHEIPTQFSNIASVHADMGNFDKAFEYYKKTIEIEDQMDRSKWHAAHRNNIASLYNQIGNSSEAIKYYKESIQISEYNGDIRGIATTYTNLGNLYCDISHFQDALEVLNQALDICNTLKDDLLKSTVLNNIGMVFHELKKLEIALDYYQKSIDLGIKFGIRGLAERYNNVGNIYKELGNEQYALKYFQNAIKFALENHENFILASLYNSAAQIYHDKGNFSEAIKYYEKSLNYFIDASSSIYKAVTLSNLGELYYDTGDLDKALQKFEECLQIAKANSDLERLSYYAAFIAAIYEKMNDFKLAYKFLKLSIKFLESQENPDSNKLKGLIKRLTKEVIPKLINKNYSRNDQCFCGSRKKFKDCHQIKIKLN